MKDFVKWLGVNDKIAKLIIWMFVIMVMLIVTNTMLSSIGFPHYQITYNNLKQINTKMLFNYLANWLIVLVGFYSICLLIFPAKEYKKLFKFGILYLILNVLFSEIFTKGITDVFIVIFICLMSYFYSKKNTKYILYAIISVVINIGVQGIVYLYKMRFIDFDKISEVTKLLLSIDYFIIMGIIILVKEIYLRKRSEKNG